MNRALADPLRPGADVLLLNPDARIDLDGVRALTARLAADPRLAAVGPEQVDDLGDPSRVVWPFPTPRGVWRQAVGLGLPEHAEGFVIGSVLLLRAEALAEVGGFDEAFFLYAEETDWQRRARAAGWSTAVADGAWARHTGAATSTDPRRRETHFHAGQERYLRKHHGAAGWQLARLGVLAGALVRSPLPGETGSAARTRLRLHLRGPVRAEVALGDPRAERSAVLPALPRAARCPRAGRRLADDVPLPHDPATGDPALPGTRSPRAALSPPGPDGPRAPMPSRDVA
ncbi:glycosyltransferase family 2 protein [Cellulomonas denverensis]|uniref:glycosyltransferase family 2 protein n=1 Tax=Cellulomonas denverensis TaxID=264297 RepID=UPI0035E5F816